MVLSQVRKLAGKVLMAGALGLGALGSAQATLVVGVWDPQYDAANFGDLGWRGRIEITVPNGACLTQVAGTYGIAGFCAGATITSAVVELYDVTQAGEPTLESLDLLALLALSPTDLTAIELAAPGDVSGLEINPSGSFQSPLAATFYTGPANPVFFSLDVSLTAPKVKMDWVAGAAFGSNVGDPDITYFIPEPTGLALAGVALLGLGLSRRRRQA